MMDARTYSAVVLEVTRPSVRFLSIHGLYEAGAFRSWASFFFALLLNACVVRTFQTDTMISGVKQGRRWATEGKKQ
jgi:hypothetical protein